MKRQEGKTGGQARRKLSGVLGFTMVELLIVVVIIAILSSVAFVSVQSYQLSLAQLERDAVAKEIFIAAQNHLTTAKGQGYLDALDDSGLGVLGEHEEDKDGTVSKGVYYIAVYKGSAFTSDNTSAIDFMLPFGSIDETVRAGGCYLIRYQPETARVLDVFYCTTSGSPAKFNFKTSGAETGLDYTAVMALRDDGSTNRKQARRSWSRGVLGWYGGTQPETLEELKDLKEPELKLFNEEKLYLQVTDNNFDTEDAQLTLIVEGLTSGAKLAIPLSSTTNSRYTRVDGTYTVVLDDITTEGLGFKDLNPLIEAADPTNDNPKLFIPGENIRVRAVAFSNSKLAKVLYSAEPVTNSLFAGLEKNAVTVMETTTQVQDTALIGNIRHLENLCAGLSDMDHDNHAANALTNEPALELTKAKQTTDLSWNARSSGFQNRIYVLNGGTDAAANDTDIVAIAVLGTKSSGGQFLPIDPGFALSYDGQSYSISNVVINEDNAGLFSTPTGTDETEVAMSVSNLELIDFAVTGSNSAGMLAGHLNGASVTNVLARERTRTEVSVTGSGGAAGGLIGSITGGTVSYSAAAVLVGGAPLQAGGLIGSVTGSTITACYSGGHTKDGVYTTYNVSAAATGSAAGGLVGAQVSGSIINCYSTCSVRGAAAGGFVGTAGGTIENCYCTGLVTGEKAFIGGALGDGLSFVGKSYYFEIVNEYHEGNKTLYREGGHNSVEPFDTMDTYNTFVGTPWATAVPYDGTLLKYYNGYYSLKSMANLNGTVTDPVTGKPYFVAVHYGDWPCPDTFIINE